MPPIPEAAQAGCPTEVRLILFAARRIEGGDIKEHLSRCAACVHKLEELAEDLQFLPRARVALTRDPAVDMDVAVTLPTDLPGYKIDKELSRGGQGVVFRAEQVETKRSVALKVLVRGAFASIRERRRFEREVEIAATLRHPNIVTVFDAFSLADGRLVLAMEFIEGLTVDRWHEQRVLAAGPTAARQEAMALVARIAMALGHAHHRGVIHRDLKPSNILVDAENEPHILDFGLARRQDRDDGASHETQDAPTTVLLLTSKSGIFNGTPAYASPEQLAGDSDEVDTRSDLYALGVVAFELVTGMLPKLAPARAVRSINEPPRASRTVGVQGKPPVDRDLDAVLLKALAPKKRDRYSTAEAFAADLDGYLRGGAVAARWHEPLYRWRKRVKRHRFGLTIAAVSILTLAGLGRLLIAQQLEVARRRESFRHALVKSTIDQARAMRHAANWRGAEELLWPALIDAEPGDLLSPDAGFRGSPAQLRAYWALWEIMEGNPCRMTLGHPSTEMTWIDGQTVGTISPAGKRSAYVPPDFVPQFSDLGALPSSLCFSLVSNRPLAQHGSLVLLRGADGLVLGDLAKGRIIETIPCVGDTLCAAGISLLGDRLAYVTSDGDLFEKAIGGGDPPQRKLSGLRARAGAFASNSWFYGQCEKDWSVTVWDLATLRHNKVHVPDHLSTLSTSSIVLRTFDVSAAGMAAVHVGPYLLLANLRDSKPALVLAQNVQLGGNVMRFSADGLFLAAGCSPSDMLIWSVPSGVLMHQLGGLPVAWPMPEFLNPSWLTARTHSETKIWDLESQAHWGRPLGSGSKCAFDVRFDRDGRRLVVAYADHNIGLWDLATSNCRRFETGSDEATSADVSPDGRLLASAGYDDVVRVLRIEDGKEIFRATTGRPKVLACVRFSADGSFIAWGDRDRLGVASVHSGSVRYIAVRPGRTPQLALSRDGKIVVSTSAPEFRVEGEPYSVGDDSLTAHAIEDGHEVWRCRVPARTRALAFSPNESAVAFGCDDTIIRIVDAMDGHLVRELKGVGSTCFGLAYHPLGRLLFSAHRSGEFAVWDVETGESLATFKASGGFVSAVAISPDGNTVATSGEDGLVRTWDLTYFRPHLAANLRHWREKLSGASTDSKKDN